MNHSTNKEVNISRWVLKQRLDSKKELRFILPDQVLLQPGRELRIYSKRGADAAEIPPTGRCILSSLRQEFVNNDVDLWGM